MKWLIYMIIASVVCSYGSGMGSRLVKAVSSLPSRAKSALDRVAAEWRGIPTALVLDKSVAPYTGQAAMEEMNILLKEGDLKGNIQAALTKDQSLGMLLALGSMIMEMLTGQDTATLNDMLGPDTQSYIKALETLKNDNRSIEVRTAYNGAKREIKLGTIIDHLNKTENVRADLIWSLAYKAQPVYLDSAIEAEYEMIDRGGVPPAALAEALIELKKEALKKELNGLMNKARDYNPQNQDQVRIKGLLRYLESFRCGLMTRNALIDLITKDRPRYVYTNDGQLVNAYTFVKEEIVYIVHCWCHIMEVLLRNCTPELELDKTMTLEQEVVHARLEQVIAMKAKVLNADKALLMSNKFVLPNPFPQWNTLGIEEGLVDHMVSKLAAIRGLLESESKLQEAVVQWNGFSKVKETELALRALLHPGVGYVLECLFDGIRYIFDLPYHSWAASILKDLETLHRAPGKGQQYEDYVKSILVDVLLANADASTRLMNVYGFTLAENNSTTYLTVDKLKERFDTEKFSYDLRSNFFRFQLSNDLLYGYYGLHKLLRTEINKYWSDNGPAFNIGAKSLELNKAVVKAALIKIWRRWAELVKSDKTTQADQEEISKIRKCMLIPLLDLHSPGSDGGRLEVNEIDGRLARYDLDDYPESDKTYDLDDYPESDKTSDDSNTVKVKKLFEGLDNIQTQEKLQEFVGAIKQNLEALLSEY